MTLVLASICNDGIAFVADGRALLKADSTFVSNNEIKIMELATGVYWGIAINDVFKGELAKINQTLQYIIKLDYPYMIDSIALQIGSYLKHYYKEMPTKPDFSLVLAGYNKDRLGNSSEPKIFLISNKLDYGNVSLPTVAAGVFEQNNIENKTPSNVKAAIKYFKNYIDEVTKADNRVGGEVTSVIIEP